MGRLVVSLTALLIALGLTRRAVAGERPFALAWSAPNECPDGAAVGQYVDEVLSGADAGPVAVRAVGSVARESDGTYAVTLDLDAGAAQPSKRALSGADCESVSRAAALVIGLAVRARVEPAPAPLPLPELPPPRPLPRRRGFVSLLALADAGASPKPTLGVGLAGGARWPHVRFESMLGYFAPRSTSIAAHPQVGAQFQLATAGVRVCGPFSTDSVWVAPCVGAGVDWLRARGFGARSTREANSWALVGSAGLLAGWDISPIISAHLELEGVLPFARPEFVVDGDGGVYRRGPLAARAAFGFDVHF